MKCLNKFSLQQVTPAGRRCLGYDEETWKPEEQKETKEPKEDTLSRENRLSKSKRVKSYLKKCKNAIGSRISGESDASTASWYVDKHEIKQPEAQQLDDIFETCPVVHFSKESESASIVELKRPCSKYLEEGEILLADDYDEKAEGSILELGNETASPLLREQEQVAGNVDNDSAEEVQRKLGEDEEVTETRHDVESIVDRHFGGLYGNYARSKRGLVRQARDLLVCEYHGCLQKFETEFCVPASRLLHFIKDEDENNTGCSPKGWPLCLGETGIIIHLGPICPTLVRNLDCYLCVRTRIESGLELALVYKFEEEILSKTLAEFKNPLEPFDVMCTTHLTTMDIDSAPIDESDELPALLQNLLVSIEHAIERVPLDDLTFPCPQCLQYLPIDRLDEAECAACSCHCSCGRQQEVVINKRDTSIQTTPMFEFVGSIPHIDSDEDEDKDSIKSGVLSKKSQELFQPTRITELPEKLLMSGLNLPGTMDIEGRPIILCYAECIARAGLNKYEIAKLLLYYASIPSAEKVEKGFTILLLAETDQDNKVLEILDKSAILIANHVKFVRMIVWRPGINPQHKSLTSRIQAVVVSDESTLSHYISKEQTPASCGGSSTQHDQLEWVEFFRQLEPFLSMCRTAGRALLSALSQLRHEEIPYQVTRRFLNHQCRQISKAIQIDVLQTIRQDGPGTLTSLDERAQWLSGSGDVQRAAGNAKKSFATVNRVATRLEKLAAERKERLKELSRLRALQDEAEELLNWIRKEGEETVKNQFILLRTAESVAAIKELEKNFENFQFDAMRQIDKTNDLIDESNGIKEVKGKNLKEQTNQLKIQSKSFSEQLEELRERLEDSSRCFQLLDSCQDILEDDNKEQEEFKRLAFKSGNEKLIQICKGAKSPIDDTSPDISYANSTSTPVKPSCQIRRRSVSSYAFIYKCNHHAAGVSCNCCESDTENTVSYKLKKKYIQTLQSCGCSVSSKDSLERKSSVTLDGIKEVRESVENLLENIDNNRDRCGRCDSGVSTADNSVGDDSGYKKKLERSCSCQYFRESCPLCSTTSSSTESNQDHTENQQDSIIEEGSDGFVKSSSSDDIDDHFPEERRKVLPVPSNSHLYCHSSILDLPSDSFDVSTDAKTQKILLYIMREMIQTERDYVKSLDYVIENYIPELAREDIPQALRGQRNIVFGNVEKIYEFHSQHFLRELEQCENYPLQVGQIFLKYDKRFYLYALYNKNKPKSDSLMSEYGTSFFKSKQLQLGDKMDLASYLLKPVQRMGKYALLLQQMMKACPELPEGASERAQTEQDDLKQAEQMVRFKLRHGNDLLAMDSIRECDVNLKEQGRLLRQNEFLVWEGKNGKKSLRQVFLFEELILFSKARRFPDRKNLDLYIYKNSIKMTDIGLTAKIGDSPTKFEIWFRKRKPNDTFTLQSMSEDIKKAWTEELSQLLWKQAIRNREVRMQEMSSMGIGNKPCLNIRPSKDQISDRSISFDQLCRTAPRFRNSIVGPSSTDTCRSTRRPHSVISMSSVSTSSTSSAGSGHTTTAATNLINLGYDTACDNPKTYHRSGTLNSQCSVESGIISDISLSHDDSDSTQQNMHWLLEKSCSQHSDSSQKSNNTNTEDMPIHYVPEDIPVNI